jgi:hypothetical protein
VCYLRALLFVVITIRILKFLPINWNYIIYVWAYKTGVVEFNKIRPGNEAIPGADSKN